MQHTPLYNHFQVPTLVKKMKMGGQSSSLFLLLFVCGSMTMTMMCVVLGAVDTMGEKCSQDFQKVTTCLGFATGKAETPTKECCASVAELKGRDPTCLCYIFQQTHHGSEQMKQMGVEEAKLLQLPSACKLANANATASECPKLLNIPPSSPDYAMFTNISSLTTPSTSPAATGGKSTPLNTDGSNGSKLGSNFFGPLAIAMAILISIFP